MERVIRRPRKVLLLTKSRGFPIDRSIEIDRRGIKIKWVLIPDQLYVRAQAYVSFYVGYWKRHHKGGVRHHVDCHFPVGLRRELV